MSPYVSKRESGISGMVTVRRPVMLSMSYARHSESTAEFIFCMVVRLTRLQRLNVTMVFFCRPNDSYIWNFVALGTCTSGKG